MLALCFTPNSELLFEKISIFKMNVVAQKWGPPSCFSWWGCLTEPRVTSYSTLGRLPERASAEIYLEVWKFKKCFELTTLGGHESVRQAEKMQSWSDPVDPGVK